MNVTKTKRGTSAWNLGGGGLGVGAAWDSDGQMGKDCPVSDKEWLPHPHPLSLRLLAAGEGLNVKDLGETVGEGVVIGLKGGGGVGGLSLPGEGALTALGTGRRKTILSTVCVTSSELPWSD